MLYCLDRIRSEITPQTYSAFVMVALEEKSAKETAEALNIDPQKVHAAKHRVLKRIKEILSQEEND